MLKKYALILSILFTGIIFSEIKLLDISNDSLEQVTISRVIDGDTIKISDGRTIRLMNINAPEKNTVGSELSRDYLLRFENTSVLIDSEGEDKYGRTLSRIYSSSYLNLELVKLGFSSKFLVSPDELDLFYEYEKEAISSGIGIWNHSEYFGCVKASIDSKEEIVKISLLCNVSTSGWYIKDESRKIYKFDSPFIGNIELHSLYGNSNSTTLFWNAGNVWNDDRDSIYIFDKNGKIVYSYSYGY